MSVNHPQLQHPKGMLTSWTTWFIVSHSPNVRWQCTLGRLDWHVPDCILAHVRKVSNSHENKVLIKATRTHSPIFLKKIIQKSSSASYCIPGWLRLHSIQQPSCPPVYNWLGWSSLWAGTGRSFPLLLTSLRSSPKWSTNVHPVFPMYTVDGHLVHDRQ